MFQIAVSRNEKLSCRGSEGIAMFFVKKISVQMSNLHDSFPCHILPPDIVMCHYHRLL